MNWIQKMQKDRGPCKSCHSLAAISVGIIFDISILIYRILEQRIHSLDNSSTVSDILNSVQRMKMLLKKFFTFPLTRELLWRIYFMRFPVSVAIMSSSLLKRWEKLLKHQKKHDIVQKFYKQKLPYALYFNGLRELFFDCQRRDINMKSIPGQ